MVIRNLLLKGTYRDSVLLMRLSRDLEGLDGVDEAAVFMGTENNKALLQQAELLAEEGMVAGADDLVLALRISSLDVEADVMTRARRQLDAQVDIQVAGGEYRPRTLDSAHAALPGANLAMISVPGQYAADEAFKALDRGLNVLLFSDNVSIEDEVKLKQRALGLGLLMLGPDCGTAIIDGVPLGFANAISRGRVGLVSASGIGLQQVVCLLAAEGEGVSQALGVGDRDLDDRVGGAMMLEGLRRLEEDPATEIIVLISKPPGPATGDRILAALHSYSKPCVVCFLGLQRDVKYSPNTTYEANLESTANRVLDLLGVDRRPQALLADSLPGKQLDEINPHLRPGQRQIIGLYSGGTLCYEAVLLLREQVDEPLYSNLEVEGVRPLSDGPNRTGHTLVDLGDDLFTVGRPHPMIDLRQRCAQLVQEAARPSVGVLLLDVMLGHGAHPDPASELAPVIEQAQQIAFDSGKGLA